MRWRAFVTSVVLACTAGVLAGCGLGAEHGETERRVETDTVPVTGLTAIDVWTDDGSVDVTAGDVTDVTITTTYDEPDPGDGDADIVIAGDRLTIAGSCDAKFHEGCRVGFDIVVPADLDVTITNDDGPIAVRGILGDVQAVSANGDVTINGRR